MASAGKKTSDQIGDSIGGKIATQIGHKELDWAGLVAELMPETDKQFVRRVAT